MITYNFSTFLDTNWNLSLTATSYFSASLSHSHQIWASTVSWLVDQFFSILPIHQSYSVFPKEPSCRGQLSQQTSKPIRLPHCPLSSVPPLPVILTQVTLAVWFLHSNATKSYWPKSQSHAGWDYLPQIHTYLISGIELLLFSITGDLVHTQACALTRESNQQPFSSQASAQSTEPH